MFYISMRQGFLACASIEPEDGFYNIRTDLHYALPFTTWIEADDFAKKVVNRFKLGQCFTILQTS